MISDGKLIELSSLYEEYMFAPDPFTPRVKQAYAIFLAECERLYNHESVEFRRKMRLSDYIATVVVVEINRYLDAPQTRYPAI